MSTHKSARGNGDREEMAPVAGKNVRKGKYCARVPYGCMVQVQRLFQQMSNTLESSKADEVSNQHSPCSAASNQPARMDRRSFLGLGVSAASAVALSPVAAAANRDWSEREPVR